MLDNNILDVGNCDKQGAAGKDPSLPMSSMVSPRLQWPTEPSKNSGDFAVNVANDRKPCVQLRTGPRFLNVTPVLYRFARGVCKVWGGYALQSVLVENSFS